MSAFNARTRYLRGLAGMGLTPSQAYRKQRLLAGFNPRGFNPRARYLRGLGDDGDITAADLTELATPSGANDIYGEAGPSQTDAAIAAETGLPPGIYAASSTPGSVGLLPGVAVSPSTAGSLITSLLSPSTGAVASPSWFATTNPTLGISNGMLLGGLGVLAAVVLLSGGKRR